MDKKSWITVGLLVVMLILIIIFAQNPQNWW
jgi:hypothetical protein